MVNSTGNITQNHIEIITRLYENYWETYKAKCFVKDEVRRVLSKLNAKYKLAIVSNFKVMNGIEELLETKEVWDAVDLVK